MATRTLPSLLALAAMGFFLRFAACANGTDVPDLTGDGTDDGAVPDDATTNEAGNDARPPRVDAGCPDGHTGPGCATCASGLHACGADCVPAQPNFPEAGCASGCGTSCTAPDGGSPTCSAAGTCDFACSGGAGDGGACGCPAGQRVCSDGACHACCADTDCPNNTTCGAAGVCGGCVTNFGDCDGNPANGCETSLTGDNDCGKCGNSCCTFCCLLIFDKTCQGSGTSYSCKC